MQKKLLAAVVGSMIAGQAMAVTVVDDGTNKVDIGGHVGMRYHYNDGSDNTTKGDSSRINFGFESKLTQDTTAFAKAEWGFDTTDTGGAGDFFSQRLGYVGVKNDQLGALTFGKQWSSYGQVAGWTDMFATVGGDASGYYGDDGEVLGTARADDALQYNYSINGLSVSAQTQVGSRTIAEADTANTPPAYSAVDRDSSYGLAVSYDLPMGLGFGVAYNQAKLKAATGTLANTIYEGKEKAKSIVAGVKFEADAFYVAATYSDLKNRQLGGVFSGVVEKAKGIELYGSYKLNDSFKFETGYNQLKDKSEGATGDNELKYFPAAVVYTTGPIQLSGTYVMEKSKKNGEDVKDRAVLQARYYF